MIAESISTVAIFHRNSKHKDSQMSRLRKEQIRILVLAMMLIGRSDPAHATAIFGLISWTSSTVVTTTTTTFPNPTPPPPTLTVTTTTTTVVIDPPAFQLFDITIDYNTSLFQFLGGGTLCDFGIGGDCPPVNLASGTITPVPTISSLTLGSPLTNSSLTLTDSGGAIHLTYDLTGTSNPPVGGVDENFFGLVFLPLVPLQDVVTHHNVPGNYDITFTNVSCRLDDNTSCLTDNPGYGFTFQPIPEPSTFLLLGFE